MYMREYMYMDNAGKISAHTERPSTSYIYMSTTGV